MSAHPHPPLSPIESACPFSSLTTRIRAGGAGGIAAMIYGVAAYLLFFFWFLYAIAWLDNWPVPKSIDSGTPLSGPAGMLLALLINTGLVALFAAQHTIMARPGFKRWWTRVVPPAIERSTFVLVASAIMWLLVLAWSPMPGVVWSVQDPTAYLALTALSLMGWGLVLFSSFLINHFDLFGLRQVWFRLTGRTPTPVGFRLRGPYRIVRHPLMLGFLIAFWSTPRMSVGHLVFAILFTAYIVMGTWFEERDLIAEHGSKYLDYRTRVRGLLPIPRRAA